jgi:hypothetical protein
MPWGGSNFIRSEQCLGGFLYIDGQNFLWIWEILFYYFIEYIMNPFGLYLFSFNAHDSQVWSFDGITEFFYIPFIAFQLFN